MITVNQYAAELELLWNSINWEFKMVGFPYNEHEIIEAFHAYSLEEINQAKKYFDSTDELNKAVHLAQTSSGMTIIVTETED